MLDLIIAAVITLGAIMILGFLGNIIFDRTQIPSIVWLLLFGLIIGIAFNIQEAVSEQILLTVSKFFAAIAIAIILFDGGINTDLYQLFRDPHSSFDIATREYSFMTIGPVSPLSFAGTPLFFNAFNTPEEFLVANRLRT